MMEQEEKKQEQPKEFIYIESDIPELRSKRNVTEWIYRKLNDRCWQETFDNVVSTLQRPTKDEIKQLCNHIYRDWERFSELKNDVTKYEMQYRLYMNYNIIRTMKQWKC